MVSSFSYNSFKQLNLKGRAFCDVHPRAVVIVAVVSYAPISCW